MGLSILVIDGENFPLEKLSLDQRWNQKYLFGSNGTITDAKIQFCIKHGIETLITVGGKDMVDGYMIAKCIDICYSNKDIDEVGIASGDAIFANIPRVLVPKNIKCTLVVPAGNFSVSKVLKNVLQENL